MRAKHVQDKQGQEDASRGHQEPQEGRGGAHSFAIWNASLQHFPIFQLQISDVYSMHYSEVGVTQRRRWLRDMFFFDCTCRACKKNFPTYTELPSGVERGLADKLIVRKCIALTKCRDVNNGDFFRW